ncbi:hypothetical protein HMPREF3198_01784 [Winkia neuii]|nr:hypothetical protein HMPREF3198_01784 [Winkia neuii]
MNAPIVGLRKRLVREGGAASGFFAFMLLAAWGCRLGQVYLVVFRLLRWQFASIQVESNFGARIPVHFTALMVVFLTVGFA